MTARCSQFLALIVILGLVLSPAHAVDSPYFAYVSGDTTNTIECYRFTPAAATTAAMLVSTSTTNVGSPSSYLAWSPDRTHMYALRTGNLIAAYNINSSTGALTAIGTNRSSGGTGVTHLCVHPSGKWVYTANYGSGHVGTIPVNADGTLGTPAPPVLAGANAHMVLTNKAGTRLYVPCLGIDRIRIYKINANGELEANIVNDVTYDNIVLPSGAGPRHMDFNSDESRAYVINEYHSTMVAFTHNTTTGGLTQNQIITTLPGGLTANVNRTCAHALVSNDDQTLYGSNRGATASDPNDIVSFRIAPSTGTMTLLAHDTGGSEIKHPRDFTLDPSGTVLLAASRDADLLTLFRVTPSTGLIARIGAITVGDRPTFVGVMPKQNAAPTVATAAAVAPSPVVGTSAVVSVLGADDFGEAALKYNWSTVSSPSGAVPTFSASGTNAAKSATVTFTKAGSYQVRATMTDAEGATVISNRTFTVNQTVTTITLSPTSASVVNGATQGFTASAKDQFGTTLVTPPTFVWTTTGGGTISSAGLFSATTVGGGFSVKATAAGQEGTASVTVTAVPNSAPTVAMAAAANPSPVIGTTTALSVLGADSAGEAALVYTWVKTGGPSAAVTFSANGINGAKSTTATFAAPGSYAFQVTIKDAGNLTVTSTVNVTVNPTFSSLRISPASANMTVGDAQAFTATRRDQFALDMATPAVATWTASVVDTIHPTTGVFTAPTTPGTVTVTATDGSKSMTATITVVAASGGGGSGGGGGGGGGGGCGLGGGVASLVLGLWLLARLGLRSRR